MGVSLERVQFKFASIIGELCSEPRVLSQFAVWLDLRLAEYKLKGSISLECSNDKPDPTWLNGIKEEDEPYIVSVNKVQRLSHIDSSPNSSLQGHQTTFSEDGKKNLHFVENLASDIGNRLSPNVPLKEEVNDPQRILSVNLSQYENQLTSVNRRKRQSSTIIRNSSNQSSSRSEFRSPYASENDSLSDRVYSSSQSPPIFLNPASGALFETPSDSITIQDKGIIKKETNVDQIITAARPQTESDSQYSYSTCKEENSEISPGESCLAFYGGTEEQDWRRKYPRSNKTETPEQKKIRMRELAKLRQRRCRERQKMRRLFISGLPYLTPKEQDASVDQIIAHELKFFEHKDSSNGDTCEMSTGTSTLHATSPETCRQGRDIEQIQDLCHQVQPLNLNLYQASQNSAHVPQSSA